MSLDGRDDKVGEALKLAESIIEREARGNDCPSCDEYGVPQDWVTLAKAYIELSAASHVDAPVADWYREHTEAEVRREYQSATDCDAPDHIRGESFEKWAEAEGYIRGAAPSSTDALTTWLRANAPDCGDNSCLFGGKGKGGMRTNGGCRCFRDVQPATKRIFIERLYAAFTAQPSATRPCVSNVCTTPKGCALFGCKDAAPATEIRRKLLDTDPYCPSCGHNRDKSATSTIDNEDGTKTCQRCGTLWEEISSAPTDGTADK